MEKKIVKISKVEPVTHNVKRFTLGRPAGIEFISGQAADVSINKPNWDNEKRPFTFTSLGDSDFLEFTIKIYNDHHGVTEQLGKLVAGDEIIIHDVFGTILYKDEGTFIAGGAGITPFISIFRQLQKDKRLGANSLIFANQTTKDIIMREEFEEMLGDRFINIIEKEKTDRYYNGMISPDFLKKTVKDLSRYFYICGPDPMVEAIKKMLLELGTPEAKIVIEQF
ncbi:MAG TPA: FAD-binding oxidoreductase [Cyclobacteriaceae bacterium]|nr:FAD-binding oxidoreductase [Cyclobacteriaceae bacterium]